ncbi:hypothetical protein BD560DRAFT_443475 [Blakeslea trispora]|nr:hypothetical protein BD560DRAFT_443475 [Blakeslea trispora]
MSFSEQDNSSHQQARFSFQHFDRESDFGIETSSGERIRKKKKPGRKPNPPSTQERRAQNRAAQKAFRVREQQRREERERQWQAYRDEIKQLQNRLAITTYENKYLKACVLHLTLAFLIHRGSIPHIWTESRIIPSNSHGEYKNPTFAPYGQNILNEAYQTHALLDMILDNQHIVDFSQALLRTSACNVFKSSKRKRGHGPDVVCTKFEKFINQDVITLNRASQEMKNIFPEKPKINTTESACTESSPQTIPLKQSKTQEQTQVAPPSPKPTTPNSPSTTIMSSDTKIEDSQSTHPSSDSIILRQKPIHGIIVEPPTLCTSEDLATMPTLQALHILRLQMKLGSILGDMTLASLIPTAIQRVVPHDIRIDYVPGASMRDKMIIFQGYYDIDECFEYLTQHTVFLGGDVRSPRNWAAAPEYSTKFWFLSHMVVDQADNDFLEHYT